MATIGHVYLTKFDRKLKQFNHHGPLPDYFGDLIGDKKKVKIAEVGAGPINTIGDSWPDVEVEIYASDVLASAYMDVLWKPSGQHPVVPVVYEDLENLSYPDETFDIVHCVNAVDHTSDALKAVKELMRVCKKGGWVYLRHSYNQKKRFGGHHEWNAGLKDGRAFFENGHKGFYLDDFTSHEVDGDRDKLIVSIWRKI